MTNEPERVEMAFDADPTADPKTWRWTVVANTNTDTQLATLLRNLIRNGKIRPEGCA